MLISSSFLIELHQAVSVEMAIEELLTSPDSDHSSKITSFGS